LTFSVDQNFLLDLAFDQNFFFCQLIKSFDKTPNLTENFDQMKMSSEIQSSDYSPSEHQNYFIRWIEPLNGPKPQARQLHIIK
jgi:hypothetical protein